MRSVTGPSSIAPRILVLSASSSSGLWPVNSSSSMAATSSELRARRPKPLGQGIDARPAEILVILPAPKALKIAVEGYATPTPRRSGAAAREPRPFRGNGSKRHLIWRSGRGRSAALRDGRRAKQSWLTPRNTRTPFGDPMVKKLSKVMLHADTSARVTCSFAVVSVAPDPTGLSRLLLKRIWRPAVDSDVRDQCLEHLWPNQRQQLGVVQQGRRPARPCGRRRGSEASEGCQRRQPRA